MLPLGLPGRTNGPLLMGLFYLLLSLFYFTYFSPKSYPAESRLPIFEGWGEMLIVGVGASENFLNDDIPKDVLSNSLFKIHI